MYKPLRMSNRFLSYPKYNSIKVKSYPLFYYFMRYILKVDGSFKKGDRHEILNHVRRNFVGRF